MLNIKLDETYRVKSDEKQYLLVRTAKNLRGEPTQTIEGYYSTLEYLLKAFIDKKVRQADIKTIKELLAYQKALIEELNKVLEPLEINVSSKVGAFIFPTGAS